MLDSNRKSEMLSEWLAACVCEIEMPAAWRNFFDESGVMPTCAGENRRFPRFYARGKGALERRQSLPGMPRLGGWHGIFTKNVSREGLGFLHSEQLFPRERMRVVLADGVPRAIEVTCCRRIQRRCYEIGARFIAAGEADAASCF